MPDDFHLLHQTSKDAIDNKGTEFWILMERNYDTYVDGIYVDITSDVSTTGTLEIPGMSFSENFTTTPGQITRITLPSDCQVVSSEMIEDKGIHITANHEVTVYGLELKAYTSDCFLALPLDILSTQYLVMSYPNLTWSSVSEATLGQFAVVSPYNNNQITIIPTCETYSGASAGIPVEITLNQGETYQMRSAYSDASDIDFTGTVVQSTYPVALFAGNSCASIPTNYAACDMIIEQIPPVSTWGNNFVTYPLQGRENGDTWRILSSQDNNDIYINDTYTATLNFGDFYENIFVDPATINAEKPVLVMQYSNGDDFDPNIYGNGDPFMMLIPPEEQFMDSYTFATPSSGYAYNYVTVTIPTEGIASLTLDGLPVDPGLFETIGTSGYSAAGIAISLGSHSLNNSAGTPFGIYSYGFDDYDSYGYAGGLSLEFIYEGSAPQVTRTDATIQACQVNHTEDEAIIIEVIASDPEEPYTSSVKLYVASPPGSEYQVVEMINTSGDTWSYTIPSSATSEPGLNFYFTATDGQLISTDPEIDPANHPYSMSILPNQLPVIAHDPVYHSTMNVETIISCEVTDETNYVEVVELYYRVHGGNPVFYATEMTTAGKGIYSASIPAAYVNENGTDYYISATDNYGVTARFPNQEAYVKLNQGVGIDEEAENIEGLQFYPNPFDVKATLKMPLNQEGRVSISLVDLSGRVVRNFVDRIMPAGTHVFTFKRGTLKSGVYILKINTHEGNITRKITIE
jgi:hypothetical protein